MREWAVFDSGDYVSLVLGVVIGEWERGLSLTSFSS